VLAGSRALERFAEVLTEPTRDEPLPRAGAVVALPLELLVEPPRERRIRDARADADLDTLATSMREHGLLHPIGARPLPDGTFEVMYGSRRLAAARRLGWQLIQASLHMTDDAEDALVKGVAENIHRRDLSGRERAHVLRLLADIHVPGTLPGGRGAGTGKILPPPRQPNSTYGLARRLGLSARTVSSWIGIGRSPEVLELVETEALDWTRAGEITRAPAAVRQQLIADVLNSGETARKRMTTLEIRARGRELAGSQCSSPTVKKLRAALATLEAIQAVVTDEEHQLLEQLDDQIQRLQNTLALKRYA
jgi:ParB-like chromosome segregation protein Spo0J